MTTSSVIQPVSFFDLVAFEQPGVSWWKSAFNIFGFCFASTRGFWLWGR